MNNVKPLRRSKKESIAAIEQSTSVTPTIAGTNNVLQVISTIVSAVGIITALIWLYGRGYYGGLLNSINLNNLQVSLNFEDYMVSGLGSFLQVLIDVITIFGVYTIAIITTRNLFSLLGDKIKKSTYFILISLAIGGGFCIILGARLLVSNIQPTNFSVIKNPAQLLFITIFAFGIELEKESGTAILDLAKFLNKSLLKLLDIQIFIFLGGLILLALLFGLFASYQSGYDYGCESALNKEKSVILYWGDSLTNKNNTSHTLKDEYFMLFTDQSYLYLYNATNSENLKPEGVIIIARNSLGSLEILDRNIDGSQKSTNKNICQDKSIKQVNSFFTSINNNQK